MQNHSQISYLLALFPLLGISACATAPYAVLPPPLSQTAPPTIELYVVSHGWHTGLVVPAKKLEQVLPELAQRFKSAAFYEIGWGDKGFYQAKAITSGLAVQAMFGLSGTIVHVVAVPTTPAAFFPHSTLWGTCVSEPAFQSLSRYLRSSLHQEATGRLMPIAPGIYGDSQFYEGTGHYHLFNTCNKWTAKGLNSAGFEMDATFKLTASSVMAYLQNEVEPAVCRVPP